MSPTADEHRRLAFVKAATEGRDVGLVLADDAGATYLLGIDSSVVEAIRTMPVRTPRREQPTSGDEPQQIGPREIQAFIRAGMTGAEVAQRHGIDLGKVERYEGPVLAERAWIADRARATELRRPDESISLNDLVITRLRGRGDDLASLEWDAWRRDDHRWVVQATWLALGKSIGDDAMASAHWLFDPVGHTIVPDDAAARALVDETTTPATKAKRPSAPAGGDPYRVPTQDSAADDIDAVARAAEVTTDSRPSTGTSAASTASAPASAGADSSQAEPAWTPVVVDGGKTVAQPEQVPAPSAVEASDDEQLDMWDSGSDTFDGVDEPVDAPVDEPVVADDTPSKKPATKRKAGRASIPSWDEILLGTQSPE